MTSLSGIPRSALTGSFPPHELSGSAVSWQIAGKLKYHYKGMEKSRLEERRGCAKGEGIRRSETEVAYGRKGRGTKLGGQAGRPEGGWGGGQQAGQEDRQNNNEDGVKGKRIRKGKLPSPREQGEAPAGTGNNPTAPAA